MGALVGATDAPVALHNVADGVIAAGSTDAVNGGQIYELTLGVTNAVAYDDSTHTSVTLDPGGAAATIHNVAAGVAATDAANVGQVNAAMGNAVQQANSYTDEQIQVLDDHITAMDFDVRRVRRDAAAGTAGALAAAALPQAMDPGRSAIAGGVGFYGGRVGFAVGGSFRASNGRSVYKVGVTYDSAQKVGANAGFAFQF